MTASGEGVAGLAGAALARCPFQVVLDRVDDEDRRAILAALHSERTDGDYVSDDDLVLGLAIEGYVVSNATLSRHRNRKCKCRHGGRALNAPKREAA